MSQDSIVATMTRRCRIMKLAGQKVIAIGERDGVQGPAIAECAKSAGADIALIVTQCFV